MKKFLFLGGMFPKDLKEIEQNSIGNIQYAANVLQWNIIEGMIENGLCELTNVSALFIGSWPKRFRKLFIKAETRVYDDFPFYSIPFVNAPILKNISRYLSVYMFLKAWAEKNRGEDLYIIAYSAHTPFIAALGRLKRKYDVKTHLIVPDLPDFMNLNAKVGVCYKIMKKVDVRIQKKNLNAIDSFTFLTKYMSDNYNIYNKPYVVVEGMINPNEVLNNANKMKNSTNEEIRIVYTGTMNKRYGVLNLIKSMQYINNEKVNLILCGKGDGEKEIIKATQVDGRICYKGQVSRQTVLEIQSQATILVNPRSNNEEYTKFSFPSKNLEYMLQRKPVLVFKLKGMPDEYDEVLNYFRSDDPVKMADDIMKLCKMSPEKIDEIGERTTEYALKYKNRKVQSGKIINMCKGNKDCTF